jgi:hypothetical protein
MKTPEDQVRVAFHEGFYDGVAGLLFRDGLSENTIPRHRAERVCLLLGAPARVVELEPEPAPKPRRKKG